MDKQTALAVFRELEEPRCTGDTEPLAPLFDVRLDAGSAREDDARDFSVRCSAGPWGVDTGNWKYPFEVAEEHDGIAVTINNSWIELR